MKKITLVALFIFALTSVAAAAPLMEFDKGKVALDYTYRPSLDFKAGGRIAGTAFGDPVNIGGARSFDGDANLDLGLTFGIGNRWAIQYRQYNPQGNIWGYNGPVPIYINDSQPTINVGFDAKIRTDEYNLLYSLNKNWAAFVGAVTTKAGVKSSLGGSLGSDSASLTIPELWSEDKNHFQFGMVGSYKIGDKTHFWGLASFGSDYRNWETGLSYDIGKDLQFNVNYRNTKFDKFKFAGLNVNYESSSVISLDATGDVTVKGWGFGLTYKF